MYEQVEKSNGGLLSRVEEEVEDQIGKTAKYWMSSKMRVMQKMMTNPDKKSGAIANSDHKPGYSSSTTRNYNINDTENKNNGGKWGILGRSSNCSNGHNGVRVCSDCNTTTTPLWRSGPQGPKVISSSLTTFFSATVFLHQIK